MALMAGKSIRPCHATSPAVAAKLRVQTQAIATRITGPAKREVFLWRGTNPLRTSPNACFSQPMIETPTSAP